VTTLTAIVVPARLAVTITPSIGPSACELTIPVSAAGDVPAPFTPVHTKPAMTKIMAMTNGFFITYALSKFHTAMAQKSGLQMSAPADIWFPENQVRHPADLHRCF
jgi:hypothetical protein